MMKARRPNVGSNTIRQRLIVDRDGVLEIRSPEFRSGALADVIVILDDPRGSVPALAGLVGAAKGLFASPADVDSFLHDERQSWNS